MHIRSDDQKHVPGIPLFHPQLFLHATGSFDLNAKAVARLTNDFALSFVKYMVIYSNFSCVVRSSILSADQGRKPIKDPKRTLVDRRVIVDLEVDVSSISTAAGLSFIATSLSVKIHCCISSS
jgi:hypothetical protein